MKTILTIIFFSLSLTCMGQSEKKNPIDIKLDKCLEDSLTTAGMCNCAIQAMNEWDTELNKYYKMLLDKLPADSKTQLKDAQRIWIEFRDKEFSFNSNYFYEVKQGTMYYIMSDDYKMEFVKKRAQELKMYYDILED